MLLDLLRRSLVPSFGHCGSPAPRRSTWIQDLVPFVRHCAPPARLRLTSIQGLVPFFSHNTHRAKFAQFRILVTGRANAGKTTILQRLCNTTADPMIFSPDGNLMKYAGMYVPCK